MDLISLITNVGEIHLFLTIVDHQNLLMTNRAIKGLYEKNVHRLLFLDRLGFYDCHFDSLKKIYYGHVPSNEYIQKYKRYGYFFEIHFFQQFKKIREYHTWWDKYLHYFFNYDRYTNYFFCKFEKELFVIKDLLYFEIRFEIIPDENCFSFGFAPYAAFLEMMDIHYLLGWDDFSIGMHSDDGWIYYQGQKYGFFHKPKNNDIIGCGFNLRTKEIFYVLDGKKYSIYDYHGSQMMYPCIISDFSLSNPVNYGDLPFHYNLKHLSDQ